MAIHLLQIPEEKVKDLPDAFRENGIAILSETAFKSSRFLTLVEHDKNSEVHLSVHSRMGGVEAGFAVLRVQPPWRGFLAHAKNNRLRWLVERILETCGASDLAKPITQE